jgi:hypothetical protein
VFFFLESIKDEIKSPKMGETSREKDSGVEKISILNRKATN